jgi:hypothetical protein
MLTPSLMISGFVMILRMDGGIRYRRAEEEIWTRMIIDGEESWRRAVFGS